jgi:hypothetical protein
LRLGSPTYAGATRRQAPSAEQFAAPRHAFRSIVSEIEALIVEPNPVTDAGVVR